MDRQQLRNFIGSYPAEPESTNNSDSIAIVLCTYFSDHRERPDPDPDGEHGWGQWVERMTNLTMDGMARDLQSLIEIAAKRGEK